MVVAEITKDHFYDEGPENPKSYPSHEGKIFEYEAMDKWWGWGDFPASDIFPSEKTQFKLYDDDGELYYSGWLLNDGECLVQQFVLSWAQADSGCTSIKVRVGNEYIYEIG